MLSLVEASIKLKLLLQLYSIGLLTKITFLRENLPCFKMEVYIECKGCDSIHLHSCFIVKQLHEKQTVLRLSVFLALACWALQSKFALVGFAMCNYCFVKVFCVFNRPKRYAAECVLVVHWVFIESYQEEQTTYCNDVLGPLCRLMCLMHLMRLA